MRNRRRRKLSTPSQNLDSFLDILTNTVGVLMFISLFVTLIAVEADSIVKTPLVSETKKNPRFFEIRDNKITYINDEKVGQEIDKLIGSLPNCTPPDIELSSDIGSGQYLAQLSNYRSCINNRASRLVNFRTRTDHYDVTMTNPSTFSLRYEPIPTRDGETKEELAIPESQFNEILADFDPNEDYLAFIVRPNSFSAFRAAREQAWEKGFDVGWEPHKTELPIQFGSGGRAIGVQ